MYETFDMLLFEEQFHRAIDKGVCFYGWSHIPNQEYTFQLHQPFNRGKNIITEAMNLMTEVVEHGSTRTIEDLARFENQAVGFQPCIAYH